ncbi:MAG: DUF4936 family protein [Burkholderiales bacterium]|nr:DUF4936 family protein [Burkholderiales bacterium]
MNRRLYIYFRVAERDLAAVAAAVQDFQARLRAELPALEAELQRRPGSSDGVVTVMETYAGPQGIDDAMQTHIEQAAAVLSRWLQGPRHTEVFEPLR